MIKRKIEDDARYLSKDIKKDKLKKDLMNLIGQINRLT